jgi:hypothetical protein
MPKHREIPLGCQWRNNPVAGGMMTKIKALIVNLLELFARVQDLKTMEKKTHQLKTKINLIISLRIMRSRK